MTGRFRAALASVALITASWGEPARADSDPPRIPSGESPRPSSPDATSKAVLQEIQWTSIGPSGGGFITAVAVVPSSGKRPRTIYAGCDVGGVFRSIDDGATWTAQNQGLENYRIEAIAVHPSDPRTLYLGSAHGVYKSVDGGDSWQIKRKGFPPEARYRLSEPVQSLAIDPRDPARLFAGVGMRTDALHGRGRIYRSIDGGESWSAVGAGVIHASASVRAIAVSKADSKVVYAATDRGLYRSVDGGATWEDASGNLPRYAGESTAFVRNVVVSADSPLSVYAVLRARPSSFPWEGGVYKSDDGGRTWQARNRGLGPAPGERPGAERETRNYAAMAIDPDDAKVLYLGATSWWGAGVWKSVDDGLTWKSTTTEASTDSYPVGRPHGGGLPAVNAIAIDASAARFLVFGNDMNVFISPDGGTNWQQAYTTRTGGDAGTGYFWRGRGLETTVAACAAFDPGDPNRLYFGYYDVGFWKSIDAGSAFKARNAPVYGHAPGGGYPGRRQDGGNVFSLLVDPKATNVLYAGNGMWGTNDGLLAKSVDHGETWQILGSPANGLPNGRPWALALDPLSPVDARRLYVAISRNGVYRSLDGGKTWAAAHRGLGTGREIRTLALNAQEPREIYAGAEAGTEPGGLFRSVDGGDNWTQVGTTEFASVHSIALDRRVPGVVYAATASKYVADPVPRTIRGGLYRSRDRGASWDRLLDHHALSVSAGDLHVSAVALSPVDPLTIYVGTNDWSFHDRWRAHGVLRSRDGGRTWQSANLGLTHWNITFLAVSPIEPRVLLAGTCGNGIFRGIDRELKP